MFKGSMVALVTPMKAGVGPDTALDRERLEDLVEYHIGNSTDGIVAVGTTGESATLSEQEHCSLIRDVVDMVRGRVPVIAGTGANSTVEAIDLTQYARDAGADACLLVTPYYNKPTQEGLYLHHKAIADAVAIPQILYNVPGRTACDMLPETIARLAKHDNIIGVKEATGNVDRLPDIRERCGDGFDIFSGDDETACEFMLRGAQGVISVTANVAPKLMHEMCEAAVAGMREQALELDARLAGLHKKLFIESSPIPVKWAVARLGLIEKGIRLPLTWLSENYFNDVETAMRQAGVI